MEEKQELSEKVLKVMKQFGDMPVINTSVYKSKDGKYVINEIRIKTIKPTAYYEKLVKYKEYTYETDTEQNDTYKGDAYDSK